MALLPQEPRQKNALMTGLAAVALLYAFSTFWYAPRVLVNEESADRLAGLEAQNSVSRVVLAQGGADLEARLVVYQRHIARLEQLIPQREEVPALLLQITNRARGNAVIVRAFSPQLSEELTDELYERLSYSIQVVGEYHDVGRFLADIASLPRIMTAVGLTLNPLSVANETHPDILAMTAPVQASFWIQTFVVREMAPPVLGDDLEPGGDR